MGHLMGFPAKRKKGCIGFVWGISSLCGPFFDARDKCLDTRDQFVDTRDQFLDTRDPQNPGTPFLAGEKRLRQLRQGTQSLYLEPGTSFCEVSASPPPGPIGPQAHGAHFWIPETGSGYQDRFLDTRNRFWDTYQDWFLDTRNRFLDTRNRFCTPNQGPWGPGWAHGPQSKENLPCRYPDGPKPSTRYQVPGTVPRTW